MKPFDLNHARTLEEVAVSSHSRDAGHAFPSAVFCAGGTTVVDLLKLDVFKAGQVVDLLPLRADHAGIETDEAGITIGAFSTMSEVAANKTIRDNYPAIASALEQSASPQIRNMATIGGNLLQRTRCPYFRDRHSPCNKRVPGTGCPAVDGESRGLAILGTSPNCVANYPGDLAVALVAFDAELSIRSHAGEMRRLTVAELHRLPGDRPDLETQLAEGDLITAIHLPPVNWDASVYTKIRDRASYAFALASCAVALKLDDLSRVSDIRIVLGGLAAKPWRCLEAEEVLRGQTIGETSVIEAAALCLADAVHDADQAFKVPLGRGTVMRALTDAMGAAEPVRQKPVS